MKLQFSLSSYDITASGMSWPNRCLELKEERAGCRDVGEGWGWRENVIKGTLFIQLSNTDYIQLPLKVVSLRLVSSRYPVS